MNYLDRMEADAVRMIEALQAEYIERAKPYAKLIERIRSIRPRTFYINGDLMIPVDPPVRHPDTSTDS